MRRGVLAVVILAAAVGLGSWIGLGRPDAARVRGLPDAMRAKVASADGPTADAIRRRLGIAKARGEEPAEDASGGAAAPADRSLPPSLLERDPSLLPDKREPWRALNTAASVQKAWMVAEGPRRVPGDGRRLVTLTFDDGPSKQTPAVLTLLARHKVRATFFVIGGYVDGDSPRAEAAKKTLRKIVAAGHLVGNHTYDHAKLTTVTRTQALEEIDRSAAAIEKTLGSRPTLFRPPFGALDAYGEAAVRARGLDLVLWSVEKADMLRDDESAMLRDLASQLDYKEGGVVLLHDVRKSSVHVLERLLDWLALRRWDPKHPKRMGYEIVDLPTYFKAVSADPLPFETRDELEKVRAERAGKEQSLRRAMRRLRGEEPGDG
jgi:peptidoglycan/xylan/chitin deacetylase (PgdA/CDA1 family)